MGLRQRTLRWVTGAVVTVLVAGTMSIAVVLNLPVHPPTGFTSPTGAAAAPQIVSRVTGRVASAKDPIREPGAPAVAVDFLTPVRGWAITGCTPSRGATGGAATALTRPCTVRSTNDSGLSWRPDWTTRRQLTGLRFPTARDGYAWTGAGQCPSGTSCPTRLYATVNGGRTWTLRFVGSAAWSSLTVTGPRTLWGTVGGELLESTNGGTTWDLRPVPRCIPETVAFDGSVGIVTGANPGGLCAVRSVNGGHSFQPLFASLKARSLGGLFAKFIEHTGLSAFVGGVSGAQSLCTDGEAIPSGAHGIWLTVGCNAINPNMLAVWHSSNGGKSWTSRWQSAGCGAYCMAQGQGLLPLAFVPGASTVFRTAPGALARSTDGGRTFVDGGPLCRSSDCVPTLDFLSPDQGYAATTQGLFATVNGGATWQRLWPAAGPGPLASVSLVGRGLGFAVPELAPDRILETRNGGATWRPFAVLPANTAVTLIDFVSVRAGFVYGTRSGKGVLLRTTNAGRAFTSLPLPHVAVGSAQMAALAFRNPLNGLAIDVFGDAWRTRDGGRTWVALAPPPLGHPQQIAWGSVKTAYASVLQKGDGKGAGSVGHLGLLVSHDGGRSWTPLAAWPWPPAAGQFSANALAVHGTNVWTFAYGGLLHSVDGGNVWREIRLPASALSPAFLTFSGRSTGWLLTAGGQLYATRDAGESWRQTAVGP